MNMMDVEVHAVFTTPDGQVVFDEMVSPMRRDEKFVEKYDKKIGSYIEIVSDGSRYKPSSITVSNFEITAVVERI